MPLSYLTNLTDLITCYSICFRMFGMVLEKLYIAEVQTVSGATELFDRTHSPYNLLFYMFQDVWHGIGEAVHS